MAGERILVVEDESLIALEISECLINLGYNVIETASQPEEAVELALKENPDLILMDINLQEKMDGIEVAARIHEEKDIPVIYLTAYSEQAILERAKTTEPYSYILKPFQEEHLRVTLEMTLAQVKKDREREEQQKWLYSILKSMGNIIFVTDIEGNIEFINKKTESLFGIKARNIQGRNINDYLTVKDGWSKQLIKFPLEQIGVKYEAESFENCAIECEDLSIPSADISASPLKDDNDQPRGILFILRPSGDSFQSDVVTSSEGPNEVLTSYIEIEMIRLKLMLNHIDGDDAGIVQGKLYGYKDIYGRILGDKALREVGSKFL